MRAGCVHESGKVVENLSRESARLAARGATIEEAHTVSFPLLLQERPEPRDLGGQRPDVPLCRRSRLLLNLGHPVDQP